MMTIFNPIKGLSQIFAWAMECEFARDIASPFVVGECPVGFGGFPDHKYATASEAVANPMLNAVCVAIYPFSRAAASE